ncbi:MAG: hypothetical protein H6555_12175 [Lewinellaceae bacterium]|nr:hypothetical protein [Lewinellaceae bacterium]
MDISKSIIQGKGRWGIALLMSSLIFALGWLPRQADFGLLIAFYMPAFALYAAVLWANLAGDDWRFYRALGIGLRLLLVFSFPLLSDDVYRFVWDGRLLLQGINPFVALPREVLAQGGSLPGVDAELFGHLNSPDYFSVYPPLAQFVFLTGVGVFPTWLPGSVVVMKLLLLAAEAGTLLLLPRLLKHWGVPENRVLIYALNPMLVIEIMGNLHLEGLLIFFLTLALWLLVRGKVAWGAMAFAGSVAAKLLPLLFIPLLLGRLGWQRFLYFSLVLGLLLVVLFTPLVGGLLQGGFLESLRLYFRQFEFNASGFYLFKAWGYLTRGYNRIQTFGPQLALYTLLGVLVLAAGESRRDWQSLPGRMLFAISLYLFGTPIVHPWYLALPVFCCLFTPFRYPVWWSAMVVLSYSHYLGGQFRENYYLIAVEYLVVASVLVWEWRRESPHLRW